jgi:hypothetical protein
MFLGGESVPQTPVRDLYAVFRRPASPIDLAVRQLVTRDMYFELDDDETPPDIRSAFRAMGTPLYDDARLLVGTTESGVYAVPTTGDAICLGALPDGGGSCGQPGRHGVFVAFDSPSVGSPFRLYGMVGDDGGQLRVGGRVGAVEDVLGAEAGESAVEEAAETQRIVDEA